MKIHSHTPLSATKPIHPVQSSPRRNDAREVAFGTGVPTAGDTAETVPPGALTRLEAFTQKIEKRFEHALASKDLTPRQVQALEKERDRFHSMIARFESAYIDAPDAQKMDKVDGIKKLMDSFAKSVSHILSGGTPDAGTPGPAPIDATGTQNGIDTVV